jgi:hypothetical protein
LTHCPHPAPVDHEGRFPGSGADGDHTCNLVGLWVHLQDPAVDVRVVLAGHIVFRDTILTERRTRNISGVTRQELLTNHPRFIVHSATVRAEMFADRSCEP